MKRFFSIIVLAISFFFSVNAEAQKTGILETRLKTMKIVSLSLDSIEFELNQTIGLSDSTIEVTIRSRMVEELQSILGKEVLKEESTFHKEAFITEIKSCMFAARLGSDVLKSSIMLRTKSFSRFKSDSEAYNEVYTLSKALLLDNN